MPIVAITSLSEGWSGIVIGTALLPLIPKGTTLLQHQGISFFHSRAIDLDQRGAPVNGYTIQQNTTVEVLDQNPPDGDHNDLYVAVSTGVHRDEKVWTTLFSFPLFHSLQDPSNII